MKHFFATTNDYGMMLLRVGAGAAMLPYGLSKIRLITDGATVAATLQFFQGMGIPSFITYLVIIAETIGAICLIIGFCTRFCAACLGVVMIGAIVIMFDKGYFMGYGVPLLFLIMFLPLVINGAGAWSVDRGIAMKMKK